MQPIHLYGKKFVFSVTAQHIFHMLKLQCIYASLGRFYNLSVWIVPALLYLKVRRIYRYAMQPVHLYGEKFVFSITARHVIHMLKLQFHYASLGKFYKLNVCQHHFI